MNKETETKLRNCLICVKTGEYSPDYALGKIVEMLNA